MSFDMMADQLNFSDNSMDDPDPAALAPPGDEDLLRTSPPGELGGAQAAPSVPPPGGAQGGAGSSTGRRTPIHLMPQDELKRVELDGKRIIRLMQA